MSELRNGNVVVGVYFGHNASVALAVDGHIVFALAEERLSRIKNHTGFPALAFERMVACCLGGDARRIDVIVFPTSGNLEYDYFLARGEYSDGAYHDYYHRTERNRIPDVFGVGWRDGFSGYIKRDIERCARVNGDIAVTQRRNEALEAGTGRESAVFAFVDHHAAHAYSCAWHVPPGEEWLVFTLDASGDNYCATVNRLREGSLSVLSRNLRYPSLGTFYREVTAFLGMKPDEHEFKVMGLAPYARGPDVTRVYDKLAPLFWVNDAGCFESRVPAEFTKYFLLQECVYDRFDHVAAAAQLLLEKRVTEWIRWWVCQTGIRRVGLAGGVFMNVKLNQRVCACEDVEAAFVVPSASDESTVMGCCYWGCARAGRGAASGRITDLYLGPAYSPVAVEDAIGRRGCFDREQVEWVDDIEGTVAALLARGEVVGRFAGRSEWGARALGNRSLLADPRRPETVRIINEMIKGRDFWMPFTPSILAEDGERYVVNPKKVFAPYMTMTFDTTDEGRRHFGAAVHPYDMTMRPQIVVKEWNPRYHALLRAFKRQTGVGGVLNTSLNLHGQPTVLSPDDAIDVLRGSQLRHLALENWLISRR